MRLKIGILIMLVLIYSSVSFAYTIVDDTVTFENEYGQINVTPHTDYGLIRHEQYARLTSYIASQDLDFAVRFDFQIKGNIYLWQNVSHSITDYYINETCRDTENGTFCYNESIVNGSHLEYWHEWIEKTHLFNHDIRNGKHYYWIQNVPFEQYETKDVKWIYYTPINTDGKWEMWIKRSVDTMQEALDNNRYVRLDPWWNSTWEKRVPIEVSNNNDTEYLSHYQLEIEIDYDSDMQPDFDDIRFTHYNASSGNETELNYYIKEKIDSTNATVVVRLIDFVNNTNTTCYMYYNNSNAVSQSNPNTTYDFYDDFNDNSLDTNLWDTGDTGGGAWSITETGGELKITKAGLEVGAWEYASAISKTNFTIPMSFSVHMRGHTDFDPEHIGYVMSGNYTNTSVRNPANVVFLSKLRNTTVYYVSHYMVVNGTSYQLKLESGLGTNWTDNHTMRIDVTKTQIRAWLNDNVWSDWKDHNLSIVYKDLFYILRHGSFRGASKDVYFDNATVRKYVYPEPTYLLGAEETTGYISLTFNFALINFSAVSDGTYNNSAVNDYNITVDTTCNFPRITFYTPSPPMTYSAYTIPNVNVKFNYTILAIDYPALLTLDVNRTVNITDNDVVYPDYYLDVPSGQHAGTYSSTNHTISGWCI